MSPILSATVAMSLASRRIERHAWVEREARLSIVGDAEVGEGLRLRRFSSDGTLLFAHHQLPSRAPPALNPAPNHNASVYQ